MPTNAPAIDLHVHVAAKDRAGCRVAPAMRASPAFAYMVLANKIDPIALAADFDATVQDTVLAAIEEAEHVDRAVVLALDAIVDQDGTERLGSSGMVVSNGFVRELARTHPRVLFGASVHPNRGPGRGSEMLADALWGDPPAALVKWLPNAQLIDPSERRHDWFYEALVEADVPLLCHAGPEHAVPVPAPKATNQRLGDPRRLRRALDIGVTVIVAHAGARFFPGEKPDYLGAVAKMMSEAESHGRWSLYADLSAMCVVCRVGIVDTVLRKLPHDRLLLGSDYPVPVNDMPPLLVHGLTIDEHTRLLAVTNPLDKNYRQLLAMGFPPDIGHRAASLLPARALA